MTGGKLIFEELGDQNGEWIELGQGPISAFYKYDNVPSRSLKVGN
jgi:hypothetical protein